MSSDLWAFGYVSRSCIPADDREAEVARLVAGAVAWNASMRVTGALLCTGEHFAQWVEGPLASLVELRNRIEIDPRHAALVRFQWGEAAERRFSRWALAYSGRSSYFARYLRRAHNDQLFPGDAERLVKMMQQFVAVSGAA